ncbi:MAG: hypothetical protein HY401_02310 [Elusimicrobia bacterium]|nr:hypothetical protein [Elusimicrobiota bacterium]
MAKNKKIAVPFILTLAFLGTQVSLLKADDQNQGRNLDWSIDGVVGVGKFNSHSVIPAGARARFGTQLDSKGTDKFGTLAAELGVVFAGFSKEKHFEPAPGWKVNDVNHWKRVQSFVEDTGVTRTVTETIAGSENLKVFDLAGVDYTTPRLGPLALRVGSRFAWVSYDPTYEVYRKTQRDQYGKYVEPVRDELAVSKEQSGSVFQKLRPAVYAGFDVLVSRSHRSTDGYNSWIPGVNLGVQYVKHFLHDPRLGRYNSSLQFNISIGDNN